MGVGPQIDPSGFFEDILSLPSVGSTTEAIELDVIARSIEHLLNFVNSPSNSRFNLLSLEWYHQNEILDVARKFDCPLLQSRILESIDVSNLDAWVYWRFLAEISLRNDVVLGRHILRQLNRNKIQSSIWHYLDMMDERWSRTLRRELGLGKGGTGRPRIMPGLTPTKSDRCVEWIEHFDPYAFDEEATPSEAEADGNGESDGAQHEDRSDDALDDQFAVVRLCFAPVPRDVS